MSLLAGTLGPTAMWYLARATGAVALLLLTGSVVLGILGPLRVQSAPRWPRFAIGTLHRDISLLVLVLLVAHILTSVLDGFAPIGLLDSIIPFRSPYRPLWLGLGAVSFDLLIALVVTSLVRRRLGYRAWRAIHWLAYVSWPVAVLHGLGTGSDIKQAWMLGLTAVCLVAVTASVLARVKAAREVSADTRRGLRALAVLTPVGLLIFTVAGPLAAHWAQRAGTPASLLGIKVAARVPARVTRAPAGAGSSAGATRIGTFSAQLAGRLRQSTSPGGELVDISLNLSGGLGGVLRIRLAGLPSSGGGVSLTGSQVDLAAAGLPVALTGKITSLVGSQFAAKVQSAQATLTLHGSLQIDSASGRVTGQLQGAPAAIGVTP